MLMIMVMNQLWIDRHGKPEQTEQPLHLLLCHSAVRILDTVSRD